VKSEMADVRWAIKPDGKPAPTVSGTSNKLKTAVASNAEPNASGTVSETQPASSGLQMNDISGDNGVNGSVVNNSDQDQTTQPTPPNAVEPPVGTQSAPPTSAPSVGGNGNPAVPPANTTDTNSNLAQWPSARKDNGGLPTVTPPNSTPLPEAEKAAPAPAQVNDASQTGQPVNTVAPETASNGKKKKKNPKPRFESKEESSSTHKKKKGLHKLNPF
jgi:outer membrane protein assembly factor BamD